MNNSKQKINANTLCARKFLPVVFLLSAMNVFAQNKAPVSFGKIAAEDFTITSPLLDTNANGIIIADIGDISFAGNEKGWFSYVFKRSTRILIKNKNAFKAATVQIPLYRKDDDKEKAENITGSTYNMENGKVVQVKLNTKDVFEEKEDKEHFYKKFALPAVREGSIIEYSYTVKSDFIFVLPSWEFQSTELPVLWSDYSVTIPGLLSYMSSFQGNHSFFIKETTEGFANYTVRRPGDGAGFSSITEQSLSVSSPTVKFRWVINNLPAFKAEDHITSPVNYIDKIGFQLYKTYDGENFHDVAKDWKKVCADLLQREDFGKPLADYNGWIENNIAGIVAPGDDALTTAKKIYYYIQDNYTCNNDYNRYIKTSLLDVAKKKSGSVGEINLLLVAMLRYKNISASPVLLSTREFGRNPADYPMLERINYVVSKATINSVDYYLDATIPFLKFGSLPAKCYNGHGRIVTEEAPPVYFQADSINESGGIGVVISNSKEGLEGNYRQDFGFFESLDMKSRMQRSSLESYKKELKQSCSENILIDSISVNASASPEEQASVKFDFHLTGFNDADVVYFEPLIGRALEKNPFAAAERSYPVEMPYTTNDFYSLDMEIPAGYVVDELPKSVRLLLNGTEGSFEYIIKADEKTIQLVCVTKIKKANFTKEDYKSLRDFYTYIVKKEAEQIVFKKKK